MSNLQQLDRHRPKSSDRFGRLAAAACLLAAILLYATAPKSGNFWWSESSRNALNGAFVLDFIRELPLRDPVGWAYRYYDQYPALTIFFYPPLFYGVLGAAYALFGVSHPVAQGIESFFVLALALGGYALARRFLKPLSAIGAALALVGAPELALWGREVMLDIPALAFVMWSLWATVRLVETRRMTFLYAVAAFLLGAVYMKINAAYIALVIAIVLLRAFGLLLFRSRHFWIAAGLFAVGLMPVAAMQLYFGSFNVVSALGQGGESRLHPFNRLESWLYYPRALPELLGWFPTIVAAAALIAILVAPAWRRSAPRLLFIPLLWLAVGTVVFGLVSLKETRHAITFMFPLLIVASYGIERTLGRFGPAAVALFGSGVLAATLFAFPAARVDGYQAAADYIAANAPQNGLIMFSGIRDGNFIFDLRSHGDRRDLSVWRADKLLVDVVIMRDHGIRELGIDEDMIRARIHEEGVSYVVAQDGFWTDLGVMQRFEAVLHGPEFEAVKQIPIAGTLSEGESTLTIYRALGSVSGRTGHMLNTPSVGKSVTPQ